MIINELSRRYAKAFFQCTQECKEIFDAFGVLLSREPELKRYLLSPEIPLQAKEKLLSQVIEGEDKELFLKFLLLVMKKGRFQYIKEILRAYRKLVLAANNIIEVHFITAVKAKPETVEKLKQKLESSYQKAIMIKEHTDPKLIGGARLIVEGKIIDQSLSLRLNDLKQHLLEIKS